jgi:hypothetical protein
MRFSPYVRAVWIVALFFSASTALAARQGTVSSVAIVSNDPFQLQIRTNGNEAPQIQIVSSPERLVVDIPNALPGPALHGISVHRGDVRGVRISLFSTTPPITRIVVDLNQPQWYKVTPNATGVLISLGSDSESAIDTQSTIGWVSTKSLSAAKPTITQRTSFEVRVKGSGTSKAPPRKGLSIEFADGLMTIHSGGATLSEILFQIQKVTGAEIAIPAGTEQDKVASDFGPGPASEVLGELLNGTGLNFVVVGSEADHNMLRSVILSRKLETQENPSSVAQTFTPPPTADNTEPEYQEAPPPDPGVQQDQNMQPDRVPDPNAQPGQQVPATGPPPDPPPS